LRSFPKSNTEADIAEVRRFDGVNREKRVVFRNNYRKPGRGRENHPWKAGPPQFSEPQKGGSPRSLSTLESGNFSGPSIRSTGKEVTFPLK